METESIYFTCYFLFFFHSCETQSNLIFRKIASFKIEPEDYTIKEVFLSKIVEENWIGALMFCGDHNMELLQIESLNEAAKIFRALKLHWLDFDDEVIIDGVKSNDGYWTFLSSGEKLNSSIVRLEDVSMEGNYIKISKNGTNVKFGILKSECERKKFLCQKITSDQFYLDTNELGPLQVEVVSRILENIGNFESYINSKLTKTFLYINRNYGLSHPKAAR